MAERSIRDLIAESNPWDPRNAPVPVPRSPNQGLEPLSDAEHARLAELWSAGRIKDAFRDLRVEDRQGHDPLPSWYPSGEGGKYLGHVIAGHVYSTPPDVPQSAADLLDPLSVAAGIRDVPPKQVVASKKRGS